MSAIAISGDTTIMALLESMWNERQQRRQFLTDFGTVTIEMPSIDAPSVPAAGCWVAAHQDRSGVYVFDSEIEALRYANNYGGMSVQFVKFGNEIFETQRFPDQEQ